MTKGLDLSHHQRGLKMSAVKAAGYDFVILRGSYTGYGAGRGKYKDGCFEGFYKDAKQNGLGVGCYHYSCADSREQAIAEAEFLYSNCLKGKQFEYPIYLDVEEPKWQSGKPKAVTDAIIAFCEYLEERGYFVGLYASLSWFDNQIQTARLDDYCKWVAAWRDTKPAFKYSGFGLWQNSSSAYCAGMRVDSNIALVDYPSIIKKAGLNGFKKSSGSSESTKNKTLTNAVIDAYAGRVMLGEFGNGAARKTALKADLKKNGYSGTDAEVKAIQDAVNDKVSGGVNYMVQRGDTLSAIAKRFGTTVRAIAEKNGIRNVNKIQVGQMLKI